MTKVTVNKSILKLICCILFEVSIKTAIATNIHGLVYSLTMSCSCLKPPGVLRFWFGHFGTARQQNDWCIFCKTRSIRALGWHQNTFKLVVAAVYDSIRLHTNSRCRCWWLDSKIVFLVQQGVREVLLSWPFLRRMAPSSRWLITFIRPRSKKSQMVQLNMAIMFVF